MTRTELLQEIRTMRFDAAYEGWRQPFAQRRRQQPLGLLQERSRSGAE
jgi:hypothetical protein